MIGFENYKNGCCVGNNKKNNKKKCINQLSSISFLNLIIISLWLLCLMCYLKREQKMNRVEVIHSVCAWIRCYE